MAGQDQGDCISCQTASPEECSEDAQSCFWKSFEGFWLMRFLRREISFKNKSYVGMYEMAQWVKVLAAKPEDPSLIPKTPVVEGEN